MHNSRTYDPPNPSKDVEVENDEEDDRQEASAQEPSPIDIIPFCIRNIIIRIMIN